MPRSSLIKNSAGNKMSYKKGNPVVHFSEINPKFRQTYKDGTTTLCGKTAFRILYTDDVKFVTCKRCLDLLKQIYGGEMVSTD